METIRLKTNTPMHLTFRTNLPNGGYEKKVVDWDFEHGFVQEVTIENWDWLQNQYVDRTNGIQYKNIFKPI